MKPGVPNRTRVGARLRLFLYAVLFALCLIPVVIEVKTGIPIGAYRRSRGLSDQRSWDETWTALLEPDRLPVSLAVFVVVCAAVELWIRFGKTEEDIHSPSKPFTRPWLIATAGYTVSLIALYVYAGSDWASDTPLSMPALPVAIAPIFVSLGLLGLYTGEVRLRYGTLYQGRNPVLYWTFVALILLLGVFMFVAGIGLGNGSRIG